jgi:glycosyltransferase involved in cell wall biosynthesis
VTGLTSVVLPVRNQAGHIGTIVNGYVNALEGLPGDVEMVLVTNACTDHSVDVCAELAADHEGVRLLDIGSNGGWGRAVKAGLTAADGDLLCYTNSARTTPEMLRLVLVYAMAYPGVAVKANRKLRDSMRRRLGSLIYNLECRLLFDLPWWDVNGTPKAFPRSFDKLLTLDRDNDLIDAEFSVICKREGYPIVEVPLLETRRHSGKSTTNYRSAFRMYAGAYRMWREQRR